MKKIISLLLAMIMLSALCACGKELESNDNSNASTDPSQSESNASIDTSFTADDLVGDWYDLKTSDKAVFSSEGDLMHYEAPGYDIGQAGKWEINGDKVSIRWRLEGEWTLRQKDGFIEMTKEDNMLCRWEALPWETLGLGEAADDGAVKVTLDQYSFSDQIELPADMESAWKKTYSDDIDTIGDDQTFIRLDIHVTNSSKSEIEFGNIHRKGDFIVDYNNGFLFETRGKTKSYFMSGNEFTAVSDGTSGNPVAISPLATKAVIVYIPCAKVIATDESAPLSIHYIGSYDGNTHYFNYVIR